MKLDSSYGGCGALQIKSAIGGNTGKVKEIIDSAFEDIMPQRVLTVAAQEQVPAALSTVSEFLKERRESSQVAFLILDLFLVPSELRLLEREAPNPGSPLAWAPDAAQFRDFLCPYGEVQGEASELHFGTRCLWSLRILHSLWRFLDPSIIVIFNAGSIRITDGDLARISSRLVHEGVAWLYTEQDEEAGTRFVNYLRLLRQRAARTLQQSSVREGA